MAEFFAVNADHGLVHGGECFEKSSSPVVDMLESEDKFKGLYLGLLKVVALLGGDSHFLFEELILADHLFLLLLFRIDLDWKDFIQVLLEGLELLRCYSDDCTVDGQADAANEFGIFGVPVQDELQEKVGLSSFVRLYDCRETHVVLQFILHPEILHDKFVPVKLIVPCQPQVNPFKKTKYNFSPQLIVRTDHADSERHQLNRVLVINLIVRILFFLNQLQLFDITFKL